MFSPPTPKCLISVHHLHGKKKSIPLYIRALKRIYEKFDESPPALWCPLDPMYVYTLVIIICRLTEEEAKELCERYNGFAFKGEENDK